MEELLEMVFKMAEQLTDEQLAAWVEVYHNY